MSNITKNYKIKYIITGFLSFCCTLLPLIIWTISGLVNGEILASRKLMLGCSMIMAILITLVNLIFKYKLRSPLFILIIGLYYAIENILPLLLWVCIGAIVDEFIFTPLCKRYKEKYKINGEIDKRL